MATQHPAPRILLSTVWLPYSTSSLQAVWASPCILHRTPVSAALTCGGSGAPVSRRCRGQKSDSFSNLMVPYSTIEGFLSSRQAMGQPKTCSLRGLQEGFLEGCPGRFLDNLRMRLFGKCDRGASRKASRKACRIASRMASRTAFQECFPAGFSTGVPHVLPEGFSESIPAGFS